MKKTQYVSCHYQQTAPATKLSHRPVVIGELKGFLAAWESLAKGRCEARSQSCAILVALETL